MRNDVAIEICGVCLPGAAEPFLWSSSDLKPSWALQRSFKKSALLNLGAFSCSVEEGQSIAQSGVTSFSLVADDNSAIGSRPIDLFTRVGAENLTASQVWGTYTVAAGDTSISVVNPPGTTSAAISAYTVLHIGSEMILTTSAHAAGEAAPFSVLRGQGRTLAAPHRAAYSGYASRTIPVTLYPVEWIGRRVIVYVNGQIWRIGFLTENPIVSGNQIQFSFVAAENALSVERGGDYIPPQGTTLAPTSEYTPHQPWTLFYSFPALSVDIPPGVAGYRTAAQICAMDDDDPEILQWSAAARKIGQMWYHYDSDDLGVFNYPRAFYTYEKNIWMAGENATGPNSIELEQIQNGYYLGLYPNNAVEIAPVWDTGSPAFQALQTTTAAQPCWMLSNVRTTAYSAPNAATFDGGARAGAKTEYYNDFLCFAGGYESYAVFDFRLEAQTVYAQNNISTAVGYQNKYDAAYVGVVSRRNLRPGEVIDDAPNGNLFNGLPRLNVWAAYFPNQYRPCEPDRWCKIGDVYPVRPRKNGDVHNVYHQNGCVLIYDSWVVNRDQNQVALPCDVATAYWEIGTEQIWTVALVPGIDASGGTVSIIWTEPDGVQLSATATLKRYSAGDYSPYYAYKISNVAMADGSVCVGFGTWPGQDACQITRPVRVTGNLGSICAQIIASSDGTSGLNYDTLGDGIGLPISATGALSFEVMGVSGLSTQYWQFSPRERPYNEFLELAALLTGSMIVCRPEGTGYSPYCVRAGSPKAGEAVASWDDSSFIGLPVSGTDSGLVYSGYRFKVPQAGPNADPVETVVPDWIAADMLGQGQECSIDFTGVYSRPRLINKKALGVLAGELMARFGVARRRWSVKIPIDLGLNRCVGDVVAISSDYLVSANGEVGVNNALGRIVSISHDFVGGTCDVELMAYASYGAGYSVSIDATVASVSGSTYTLNFLSDSDSVVAARQKQDRLSWAPIKTSSYYYYVYTVGGPGAGGRMYGYFSAWNPNTTGGTATFVRVGSASPLPAAGSIVLIECYATIYADMADSFKPGTDRLL